MHYEGLKNDAACNTAGCAVDVAKVRYRLFNRTQLTYQQVSKNMFDNLLRVKPAADESNDEIKRYLDTKTEDVENPIAWWQACSELYPHLHRMALDYLTIPGE